MAKRKGTFGVSHTRVPTESRPGHIAMIAGFYEDVSAVTKGWKANPVDYDHLLARAKYAWSFGAPEIVDLFTGPSVYAQHYSSEMIDFAAGDARMLDGWSFDRLREVVEAATVDAELAARLKSDQVVIFVHLLGLDTNGHAHKPHSREYLENVEYVDAKIKEAVAMLDAFYENDGKTAYLFTADHGMSDAGTHGDGDPDNTRTPFVGWGAGLSEPQEASLGLKDDHNEYSTGWGLSHLRRRDMSQADMTPLMATLVGIPIPVNSEGVLPLKHLSTSMEHKSKALLDNARQLAAGYLRKEALRKAKEPFFVPAPAFPGESVALRIDSIEKLIADGSFIDAQKEAFGLVKETLLGLRYLQKYDAALLKGICTAGYAGWILYAIAFLLEHFTSGTYHQPHRSQVITGLFVLAAAALAGLLMAKRSPLQFYVYAAFPLLFWHETAQRGRTLLRMLAFPFRHPLKMLGVLFYVGGLELLVLAFFERTTLIAVNALVALSALRKFDRHRPVLSIAWILTAVGMCCFPLLPPIKLRDERLYVAGVVACIFVSLSGYAALKSAQQGVMTVFQFIGRTALIGIAGYISMDSDAQLRAKAGLPRWNQNVAWILVAFSTLAPILANRKRLWSNASRSSPHGRLLDLMMTFAPAYILLSVAYEPLFYACFALQIALWVAMESSAKTEKSTKSSLPVIVFDHLWIVYGFLFFLNLAFFGTGNMASISSFTLESVYRLITVFSPFSMAGLLILKLLIPFCLLSAAFGVVSRLTDAPPSGLILLVVGTTDIMTLNFFYLVRDHGSWLEIGTSISHFVIASSLIVFTLVLSGLSTLFLSGVDYHHERAAPVSTAAAHRAATLLVDGDETDDSKNN